MIVVDANVIAYRFIEGEKTALACRLQERDKEWAVPQLWRHEFLNVLATTVRAHVIDADEACTIWRNAVAILTGAERAAPYERAICCASDFHISAYDAQYITLADAIDCPCITEDAKLRRAFPDIAISMQDYLNLKS